MGFNARLSRHLRFQPGDLFGSKAEQRVPFEREPVSLGVHIVYRFVAISECLFYHDIYHNNHKSLHISYAY